MTGFGCRSLLFDTPFSLDGVCGVGIAFIIESKHSPRQMATSGAADQSNLKGKRERTG